MALREVPEAQWTAFLDGFARQHEGWLCSIDAAATGEAARRVASDVPLCGVSFERVEFGESRISICVGAPEQGVRHAIESPRTVLAEETPEGVESGLQIESSAGARSFLRFRSPVAPELVDGVAL